MPSKRKRVSLNKTKRDRMNKRPRLAPSKPPNRRSTTRTVRSHPSMRRTIFTRNMTERLRRNDTEPLFLSLPYEGSANRKRSNMDSWVKIDLLKYNQVMETSFDVNGNCQRKYLKLESTALSDNTTAGQQEQPAMDWDDTKDEESDKARSGNMDDLRDVESLKMEAAGLKELHINDVHETMITYDDGYVYRDVLRCLNDVVTTCAKYEMIKQKSRV